jgi:carboxyl-terminal processing protease
MAEKTLMLRSLKAFILVSMAFFGGTVCGVQLVRSAWSAGKDPYEPLRLLAMAVHTIQDNALKEITLEELTHGAIDGMVDRLDVHSHFMAPKEYSRLRNEAKGWSVGIGILVNQERTITRVTPHSPAAISGLMVGDQLSEIDGSSVEKETLYSIQQNLLGDRGTVVQLKAYRSGEERSFEVTRDDVKEENVVVLELEPNIYYVRLERFSHGCVDEIIAKLQEKSIAPDGILLDLRDNFGGLIDEGIALADLFLGEGKIVELVGRDNEVDETYRASLKKTDIDADLVILINGGSASASELTAGALQSNKRAKLVGGPSYGKGSMQKVYEFNGTTALKLTVAQYRLPSGKFVSTEEPLEPDLLIHNRLDDPKSSLLEELRHLPVEARVKQRLIQQTTLLNAVQKNAAIPYGGSLSERRDEDPQLDAAWKLMTNND